MSAPRLSPGVIYAFAPYRFTHYMHLELQLVFWIPLLLFVIHRSLPHVDSARRCAVRRDPRDVSSCHVSMPASTRRCFAPCLFHVWRCPPSSPNACGSGETRRSPGEGGTGGRPFRPSIKPLMAAGGMTGLLALPYAFAYVGAQRHRRNPQRRAVPALQRLARELSVGARTMNRFYGGTAITDPMLADEMNLFPGAATVTARVDGRLRQHRPGRGTRMSVGLIFAIVLTAGANGVLYGWLFEHVSALSGAAFAGPVRDPRRSVSRCLERVRHGRLCSTGSDRRSGGSGSRLRS